MPNIDSIILIALKSGMIIGLLVYTIFAAIIVRQENLMNSVLEEGFEPVLRLLTFIHLIAAVGVLILAFIILPV